MKAAYITETGPPDVITYGDLPVPSIGPGQCLVAVRSVDVNPIDLYQRAGLVPIGGAFPMILGHDLVGTVMEVGSAVTCFKPGDRVWASNLGFAGRSGTFAERVAVDQDWLYPMPDGVEDEQVVALSLVGITAWLGLTLHAQLKAGEVVLVNGGSGGVGSCVIQMAKVLGARVIATGGNAFKAGVCRELGADVALDRAVENVGDRLREEVPDGVDVWWETSRELDLDRIMPVLARRGRVIVMAGRDARPVLPVGPLYVKDASIRGFAMFNASAVEIRAAADAMNGWMQAGQLKARIARVLPLAEAAEAHRLQEASTLQGMGDLTGKLVLRI